MTITVFGASGKVGRLVVAEALRRGIAVRAFVHEHNPFENEPGLEIIKGDIYSGEDVIRALNGADAVVSCLGSWGQKSPNGNRNVLTAAMQAIIPVMTAQKIGRIITLTGAGAAEPNSEMSAGHKLTLKLLAPFPVGKVFADGDRHMQLLKASDLDWTTIRSPVMNSGESMECSLSLAAGSAWPTISRQAVAMSMLNQLDSTDWLRQGPLISRSKK